MIGQLNLQEVYSSLEGCIIKGKYAFAESILNQFRSSMPEEKSNLYDSILRRKAEERGELEKEVA